MGGFKRHIDLEHCVHNKCMFDHDQLISHLKGKSVSIDVFVNSLIGAIKLSGRTGITLRGHRDASKYHPEIRHAPTSTGVGNFVHIINYAVRNGHEVLENHLKTSSKREIYLSATTQKYLLKYCHQHVTEGLLNEVKTSKIFALILNKALDISHKEQLSFCLRFVDSNNDLLIATMILEKNLLNLFTVMRV